MLRLHDTALGEVRELRLRDPGRVSLYSCGPTVYDVAHIGHGRGYLVYDILVRYLEWTGLRVDHVRNITDIDDKIIQRANETGRDPADVAAEFEKSFYDAMDALGIERPTHDPHATAYVDQMLALIGELLDKDVAYETSDGVYLDTSRVDGYGLLAQQNLDDLRSGARVEAGEEKRSPLDFVLWKRAKPGEPAWPAPFGAGRPGWHTECVVMSLDLLGDGFDLHTGGMDLKFPHHENERAQSVALGHPFAQHWMHHAFVDVGGEKMSKSLKNFTSVVDLLQRHDARAYRLLVLRSHYRSPMEVTPDTIADAEKSLARLDEFARNNPRPAEAAPDPDALARFRALMDDDLNTPGAAALMFDLVRAANASGDPATVAAVYEVAGAFGLPIGRAGDEVVDDDAAALVAARDAARAARDFAEADRLRDELQGRGWVVKDTPEGTRIHR